MNNKSRCFITENMLACAAATSINIEYPLVLATNYNQSQARAIINELSICTLCWGIRVILF